MTVIWIAIIIVVFVMYLNCVATYHVLNSGAYGRRQRIYQLLLAWLVPIFGSIVVTLFALSDKDYVKEQKDDKAPSAKLIRFLTLAAFAAGSGGSVAGAGDNGFDGDGSGSGGGGGGDS